MRAFTLLLLVATILVVALALTRSGTSIPKMPLETADYKIEQNCGCGGRQGQKEIVDDLQAMGAFGQHPLLAEDKAAEKALVKLLQFGTINRAFVAWIAGDDLKNYSEVPKEILQVVVVATAKGPTVQWKWDANKMHKAGLKPSAVDFGKYPAQFALSGTITVNPHQYEADASLRALKKEEAKKAEKPEGEVKKAKKGGRLVLAH